MSRRVSSRRVRSTLVAVLALAVVIVLDGAPAAAVGGGGGARSDVVGRGDIVTSILGWDRAPSRSGPPRPCRWRTFTDIELEWIVSVTSQLVANGHAEPVPDYVLHLLGVGNLPDGDLQARVCDGRIVDYRFVPYDAPRDTLQVLSRRMITRLPPPDPVVSPPPDAVVPVGQPVFYSAQESDWQPVDGTLTVDGVTAEVRATPVSLRIIPGDPFAPTVSCQGPGRAFDPDLGISPKRQSERPDTCAVAYTTATDGRSSTRSPRAAARDFARPASWFGTVTVLWEAEWRVDGGPWTSLGRIPRTRLIERSVREVATSIESG